VGRLGIPDLTLAVIIVKFSLLIEVQIASPTPTTERQAFLDCVEQAVLADTLGYDTVWAVEHHGFACTPTCLVLDDDGSACAYGFRGARFFGEALATYFFSPTRIVGPPEVARDPLSPDQLKEAMARRGRTGGPLVSVIGDPAAARESVQRFQAAGVDEVILVMFARWKMQRLANPHVHGRAAQSTPLLGQPFLAVGGQRHDRHIGARGEIRDTGVSFTQRRGLTDPTFGTHRQRSTRAQDCQAAFEGFDVAYSATNVNRVGQI
jgi:hypothetical protein